MDNLQARQQDAPLCTVVIPARNAATVLPACLEALRRQTLPASAFEVLVVDDGSIDHTADVARTHGVICLTQPPKGPGAARNLGAHAARGRFLVFTDADCRPEPDCLEALLRALEHGQRDGVVGVQGVYATQQASLVARFAQAEFEDRYDLMRQASGIDLAATHCAAFRRDVFLAAGGFDERFPRADNEDTELSYRLLARGHRLALAPGAVVRHLHPATLARYLAVKCRRGYWRVQVYRLYPGKAFEDRYTTRTLKVQTLAAAGWITASLAGLLAWPLAGAAPLAAAQAFPALVAALAWPLARKNRRKDKAVGAATPILCVLRATALACGALWGVLRPAPGLKRRLRDGKAAHPEGRG